MSDSQSVESTSIVSHNQVEANISLDDFKSLFYKLNAKPDTELRLLPSGKIVELSDIRSINERVRAKLNNHDVIAEIASINFVLSNKKLKEFSLWVEFERENWDTVNEKIESISITWDISLKLPHFQLPQRHSMKLRIGNVPPIDMFQLVLTSDDISELMEARAPGVCKVDFVSSIIATELLNIVSSWHEGLTTSPEPIFVQKFLRKNGNLLSQIVRFALPILILVVIFPYSDYLYPALGISNDISLTSIQKLLTFLVAVYTVGIFLGFKIENSIDRKISKFEQFPSFLITRGDKKAVEDFEKTNAKLTRQIISRFLWIVFSFVVTSCLRALISYLNPFHNPL